MAQRIPSYPDLFGEVADGCVGSLEFGYSGDYLILRIQWDRSIQLIWVVARPAFISAFYQLRMLDYPVILSSLYFFRLLFGPMPRSSGHSTFSSGVGHIVLVGAHEEMRRAATWGIVTFVQYVVRVWVGFTLK